MTKKFISFNTMKKLVKLIKTEIVSECSDPSIQFESSDDSKNPPTLADMDNISSNEKLSSILKKLTTAVRNLRYIANIIGSSDISNLPNDGSITGILAYLNNDLYNRNIVMSIANGVNGASTYYNSYGIRCSLVKEMFINLGVFCRSHQWTTVGTVIHPAFIPTMEYISDVIVGSATAAIRIDKSGNIDLYPYSDLEGALLDVTIVYI